MKSNRTKKPKVDSDEMTKKLEQDFLSKRLFYYTKYSWNFQK